MVCRKILSAYMYTPFNFSLSQHTNMHFMKYFEDMKELLNRYFSIQIIGFTKHMPIYFLANYICQTLTMDAVFLYSFTSRFIYD